MELCLRDNDPTRTLLITTSGEEMYKIETPPLNGGTTKVHRFNRNGSVGRVSTEVGKIEPLQPSGGTRLLLCAEDMQIMFHPSSIGTHDGSWAFIGPDGRPYRWQLFLRRPVLILNDNSLTPIARYRRAKLGIVSRSRRAFLEILPAGINILDLIVVTFVSFAKYSVQDEPEGNPEE